MQPRQAHLASGLVAYDVMHMGAAVEPPGARGGGPATLELQLAGFGHTSRCVTGELRPRSPRSVLQRCGALRFALP